MKISHFLISTAALLLFSFLLFLLGFFPIKHVLPGFSQFKNYSMGAVNIQQPKPTYDRLVIVLVDALRSDFVTTSGHMEFVEERLQEGNGLMFTLRAHPPTVTLPRIKALTSGTIPGFIDIVLNFESTSLQEDNLINQAVRHQKKLVFYGDDTWLKLFPEHFIRSEGTTSFFVTDYTEVDNNVTRHLDAELSAMDWDIMVLHYLGLDHIGHTVGPKSPLVKPKLQEMDTIIRLIYSRLQTQSGRSLVLVCGDHGMSDQGSHGGASNREVLVPAVFLTPGQHHSGVGGWSSQRELLQIDLAPTLSLLLGLPVPINNLGQVLVGILQGLTNLTPREQIDALYVNTQQILTLLQNNVPALEKEASYDLYQTALRLHKTYLNQTSFGDPARVLRAYELAMDAMATKISTSLTNYDLYSMGAGILLQLLCLLCLLRSIWTPESTQSFTVISSYVAIIAVSGLAVFCHVTICTSQSQSSSTLCSTGILGLLLQCCVLTGLLFFIGFLVSSMQNVLTLPKMASRPPLLPCLLWAGTLVHSASFGSSSCVEEEHQTWYFLTTTFTLVGIATLVTRSARTGVETQSAILRSKPNIIEQKERKCKNCMYDTYDKHNGEYYAMRNRIIAECSCANKFRQRTREQTVISEASKCLGFNTAIGGELPWKQFFAGVTVLFVGRCLRTLNQTGNKWLDTPDVGDWLKRPENKPVLSLVILLSLVIIGVLRWSSHMSIRLVFGAGLLGCYVYRIATGTVDWPVQYNKDMHNLGLIEARMTYLTAAVIVFLAVFRYMKTAGSEVSTPIFTQRVNLLESLQSAWILVMILLLRPHNTVVVAMVILQDQLLWKYLIEPLALPTGCLTLFCWWMGQTVFFQQGNSNSLSTVDVSAGYVGLSDYQPLLVVALLFSSTYAGPIYWLLTLVKYLHTVHAKEPVGQTREDRTQSRLWTRCIQCLLLERVVTVCLYCIVVTSQRYHLFVWTVFSPKLLYESNLNILVVVFTSVLIYTGLCKDSL